jgi:hypothetical protein
MDKPPLKLPPLKRVNSKKEVLSDFHQKVFELNRKYYKPKLKPISLNDIALKLLDEKQLLEFKSKYPKLAELEK